MKKNILRSPFFYVGDKYKLVSQLKSLMPSDIDTYIEPFVGGGSSLINTEANTYFANDIDENVIRLHRAISQYSDFPEKLFEKLFLLISRFGLSCSFHGETAPSNLKEQFPKTYYSHYNKAGYNEMKSTFNKTPQMEILYLLLIYGFNHMIRYNSNGIFNLPVGNVDFNKSVYSALKGYLSFMKDHPVSFFNEDYKSFLRRINFPNNAFVFFDPPYLISNSEYNKFWNENKERELCCCIDNLNAAGVHFGITNLAQHKGRQNTIFIEWAKKYSTYDIDSNYISFNDNTIKESSKELYVTNYVKS